MQMNAVSLTVIGCFYIIVWGKMRLAHKTSRLGLKTSSTFDGDFPLLRPFFVPWPSTSISAVSATGYTTICAPLGHFS